MSHTDTACSAGLATRNPSSPPPARSRAQPSGGVGKPASTCSRPDDAAPRASRPTPMRPFSRSASGRRNIRRLSPSSTSGQDEGGPSQEPGGGQRDPVDDHALDAEPHPGADDHGDGEQEEADPVATVGRVELAGAVVHRADQAADHPPGQGERTEQGAGREPRPGRRRARGAGRRLPGRLGGRPPGRLARGRGAGRAAARGRGAAGGGTGLPGAGRAGRGARAGGRGGARGRGGRPRARAPGPPGAAAAGGAGGGRRCHPGTVRARARTSREPTPSPRRPGPAARPDLDRARAGAGPASADGLEPRRHERVPQGVALLVGDGHERQADGVGGRRGRAGAARP